LKMYMIFFTSIRLSTKKWLHSAGPFSEVLDVCIRLRVVEFGDLGFINWKQIWIVRNEMEQGRNY
jgi:hypothetical protein